MTVLMRMMSTITSNQLEKSQHNRMKCVERATMRISDINFTKSCRPIVLQQRRLHVFVLHYLSITSEDHFSCVGRSFIGSLWSNYNSLFSLFIFIFILLDICSTFPYRSSCRVMPTLHGWYGITWIGSDIHGAVAVNIWRLHKRCQHHVQQFPRLRHHIAADYG